MRSGRPRVRGHLFGALLVFGCSRPIDYEVHLRASEKLAQESSVIPAVVVAERFHPSEGTAPKGVDVINPLVVFNPFDRWKPPEYLERTAWVYLLDAETGVVHEVRRFESRALDVYGTVRARGAWRQGHFHVQLTGGFVGEGDDPRAEQILRMDRDGRFEEVEAVPSIFERRWVGAIGVSQTHGPRRILVRRRGPGGYEAAFCVESGGHRPISWRDEGFDACLAAK